MSEGSLTRKHSVGFESETEDEGSTPSPRIADCIWWGENRLEDNFEDVGCSLSHCVCKNAECEDYAKSLVGCAQIHQDNGAKKQEAIKSEGKPE